MSGNCSAKRPNKSPVCGVEVVGQCEGNNREDEVGVLCQGGVSGGSSNVRNMTCARDGECFGDNAHKEHFNLSFSHAREKFALVSACEVRCTVYTFLPWCSHFPLIWFLPLPLTGLPLPLPLSWFPFPLLVPGSPLPLSSVPDQPRVWLFCK